MAISVDSPEDSENLRRSQSYTFPILSDAQEDFLILQLAPPPQFLLSKTSSALRRSDYLSGRQLAAFRSERNGRILHHAHQKLPLALHCEEML